MPEPDLAAGAEISQVDFPPELHAGIGCLQPVNPLPFPLLLLSHRMPRSAVHRHPHIGKLRGTVGRKANLATFCRPRIPHREHLHAVHKALNLFSVHRHLQSVIGIRPGEDSRLRQHLHFLLVPPCQSGALPPFQGKHQRVQAIVHTERKPCHSLGGNPAHGHLHVVIPPEHGSCLEGRENPVGQPLLDPALFHEMFSVILRDDPGRAVAVVAVIAYLIRPGAMRSLLHHIVVFPRRRVVPVIGKFPDAKALKIIGKQYLVSHPCTPFLSLDTSGGHSLHDVLLQQHENNDNRQQGQHAHRKHSAVVRGAHGVRKILQCDGHRVLFRRV